MRAAHEGGGVLKVRRFPVGPDPGHHLAARTKGAGRDRYYAGGRKLLPVLGSLAKAAPPVTAKHPSVSRSGLSSFIFFILAVLHPSYFC